MDYLGNAVKHFKKVMIHKKWVFYYSCKAGIPIRGLIHDMSKLSPTEFIESAKYYQGDRSPIDACKEENGYSKAWLHHKGRNTHHYEYWQDNFDKGGQPLQMPFKCALEMVCDYLAAGRAYMGKNFTFDSELEWWINKKSKPLAMHPHTRCFMDMMLCNMRDTGSCSILSKKRAYQVYLEAEKFCEGNA
jgi:hypothetical protein